jgi:hypothetical protein
VFALLLVLAFIQFGFVLSSDDLTDDFWVPPVAGQRRMKARQADIEVLSSHSQPMSPLPFHLESDRRNTHGQGQREAEGQ